MNFRELVLTRRTVHNYQPDPVPEPLVEEALSLSLWAPNHKLSFPWVYTWIQPKSRERLADLAVELKSTKGDLGDAKRKAVRDNVLNPAHLISLGIRRTVTGRGTGTLLSSNASGTFDVHREHEDFATLACSVQIISLHLWQNGVATKWSTGAWSMHENTYSVLGLNPDEISLQGVLMIGRGQGSAPPTPERPALSQFLRKA